MANYSSAKDCARYCRSAITTPTQHGDTKQKADASQPRGTLELRIGDLRVYYETKDEPEPTVSILAIGIKERDQVRIGGERFKL